MLHVEQNQNNRQAGFTLVEILAVIAIIAGLVAFIYPVIKNMQERSKKKTAKLEMRQMQVAIDHYVEDVKRVPEALSDLQRAPADAELAKKWDGPYLPKEQKELPRDPWGKPYKFEPTPGGEHEYEFYTFDSAKKRINVWGE